MKSPSHSLETNPRIIREAKTIEAMLAIYCEDHHQSSTDHTLCESCTSLLNYAHQRLEICPFRDDKPACNHCQVHCYSKEMRQRVQQVMRYSGPRMIFKHPMLSLFHLFDTLKEAPALKRINKQRP